MIEYDETEVIAFAKECDAYLQPDSGRVGVMCARMQYDACNGLGYTASRAKHLRELQLELGVALPFPPAPARDAILRATVGFQGVTAHTQRYGTFPMFGPETTTLNDDDLDAYCADILAAGFTGGEIAVSWEYDEPGFLMPVPGRDLSQDLPELTRRVARMIRNGLTGVVVFLAGDGRSAPKNPDGSYPYNDPVGHTYGCEWLMENLARIVDAFRTSADGDLLPYVIFSPGYDGVFYGWGNAGTPDLQPQRVIDFGRLFRSIVGARSDAYLAIEHTPGTIPVGNGAADWTSGGALDAYDLLLSEYTDPITGGDPPSGQVWQVEARTTDRYVAPPDQRAAAADPNSPYHAAAVDPHPANYLRFPTTRGPRYKWAYEFATYPWTRGRRTLDQINQDRAYFRALGCALVC
jgi:hypothetical protein